MRTPYRELCELKMKSGHDILTLPMDLTTFTLDPLILFMLLCIGVGGIVFLVYRFGTKTFYIVRHGQTFLNAQGIKQGAEGKLNEKGRAQAEQVGKYLAYFPIKRIFSSPYERAVETAEIISTLTKAKVIITPLLAERKNPSEVIGKSTHDPEVMAIVDRIERGYHEDSFRVSDEENFEDMRTRAAACLKFLERNRKANVAVVTHHVLLQMLLSYMLYREKLGASDYVKLAFFNPAENGGVTICQYRPWKRFTKSRGWDIIAYSQSTAL